MTAKEYLTSIGRKPHQRISNGEVIETDTYSITPEQMEDFAKQQAMGFAKLQTDEKILDEAECQYVGSVAREAFFDGAKWMRKQIKSKEGK